MMRQQRSGFTLIELLVVMGVIGIILAFVIPSVGPILKGNKLTQGAQMITDNLALARQTAISKNRNVEVRLLKFIDPDSPAQTASFRGIQTFEVVAANRFVAMDRMRKLPEMIIVDSSSQLSSLLDSSKRPERKGTDPLGSLGTRYSYMSFRFRPNGSTDLPATKGPWFLTLHDEAKGDTLSTPPANFVTIEIDPVSGTLKFYRPGV